MPFTHRLKYIEEEAFLFHFKHQNKAELHHYIDQWQSSELENEVSIDTIKTNLIILLTLVSRLMIEEGFNSESVYEKTGFIITIINRHVDIHKLHQYEKQIIDEYHQLFLLKHRKTDNLIVNHILNYLYVRLHESISLDHLASDIGISKSHCVRVFKKTLGTSILQYHMLLKLERAEFFLTSTKMSLSDIALTLGFYDQSHFTRMFKRYKQLTPKQYQAKNSR